MIRNLILFFLFYIFLFFSCKNTINTKFITFFINDGNFIIPVSIKSVGDIEADSQVIVEKIANVKINKINYVNNSLNIYLENVPSIKFEFDSYLLYSRLFLSFFNTFEIENVKFLYNNKLLILGGIEYSMNYKDYYKYPINDIFNLGDARKGKYYLFSYLSKDGNNYLIPILLFSTADFNFYFRESVKKIENYSSSAKIETIDLFLKKKFNADLIKYEKNLFEFKINNFITFLKIFFNKSDFCFLFYNSDLRVVCFYYPLFGINLKIKIIKPSKFYLNIYPLNVR